MSFKVSSSPHIRSADTTSSIMLDVIIALTPIGIASIVMFGFKAALLIAVTVASCVLSEYLWCKALKKPSSLNDLSAIVTGLLLAYNLPPTLPLWMAMLGGAIAIIIVKQMFGGIGHNFANPAITARIVLMVSFPAAMTTFTEPFSNAVTSATPLANIGTPVGLLRLFIGDHSGSLGETSAMLIILGGIYLVLRKVINPAIPLSFCASAFLMNLIFTGNFKGSFIAILSGGLLLGAVFMATDYVTSPKTLIGKIIFGIGCGVITILIRQLGNLPEGVSYSILLMNLLTPLIEKIPAKKPFGWEAKKQ